MGNTTPILMVSFVLVFSGLAYSQVKAFPTAEGYGTHTPGGRGGRVIEVTNLNDSGPGSFRDAVSQSGPRIVVFRVSGDIKLQSTIYITQPYLTIAGQTAPGGGVQIRNWSIYIQTHDVIIRHLRSRPGLDAVNTYPNGVDTNALTVWGTAQRPAYNVVLDHCDAMWSTDQNSDSYGNTWDTTLQWSIIAEGTLTGHSGTPTVPHSMGTLVGAEPWYGKPQTVSIHHSLYAHNQSRNPLACTYPGHDASGSGKLGLPALRLDFRNNVVYNAQSFGAMCAAFYTQAAFDDFKAKSAGAAAVEVNFIGNHFIPGPTWPNQTDMINVDDFAKFYGADNVGPRCPTGCSGGAIGLIYSSSDYVGGPSWYKGHGNFDATRFISTAPFSVAPVTTHPSSQVLDLVLNKAGATKPMRDSVGRRIAGDGVSGGEVRTRTGTWAKPLDYPVLAVGTPPADTDHDGMPDTWESARGLNPNSAIDGPMAAANGYTNVENYLNELAGDPIPGASGPAPPPPPPPSPAPGPVAVDSTFGGYSIAPIDDGVIVASGGVSTTWASGSSTTSAHWAAISFASATTLDYAAIHWAFNTFQGKFMTSQRVDVQALNGGSFQTVASLLHPGADVAYSSATFPPVTTSQIRFFQPANMGNPTYKSVLWLTEVDYGKRAPLSFDINGDGAVNVADVQLAVNQVLAPGICGSSDVNKDGACTVADVQLIVNKSLGV